MEVFIVEQKDRFTVCRTRQINFPALSDATVSKNGQTSCTPKHVKFLHVLVCGITFPYSRCVFGGFVALGDKTVMLLTEEKKTKITRFNYILMKVFPLSDVVL